MAARSPGGGRTAARRRLAGPRSGERAGARRSACLAVLAPCRRRARTTRRPSSWPRTRSTPVSTPRRTPGSRRSSTRALPPCDAGPSHHRPLSPHRPRPRRARAGARRGLAAGAEARRRGRRADRAPSSGRTPVRAQPGDVPPGGDRPLHHGPRLAGRRAARHPAAARAREERKKRGRAEGARRRGEVDRRDRAGSPPGSAGWSRTRAGSRSCPSASASSRTATCASGVLFAAGEAVLGGASLVTVAIVNSLASTNIQPAHAQPTSPSASPRSTAASTRLTAVNRVTFAAWASAHPGGHRPGRRWPSSRRR